jgi:hypothetical protein
LLPRWLQRPLLPAPRRPDLTFPIMRGTTSLATGWVDCRKVGERSRPCVVSTAASKGALACGGSTSASSSGFRCCTSRDMLHLELLSLRKRMNHPGEAKECSEVRPGDTST